MISGQTILFFQNESYTFNLSTKTLSLGVIPIYQNTLCLEVNPISTASALATDIPVREWLLLLVGSIKTTCNFHLLL